MSLGILNFSLELLETRITLEYSLESYSRIYRESSGKNNIFRGAKSCLRIEIEEWRCLKKGWR